MPMTLYFKRAKSFITQSENDKGTKKYLAQPGPTPQANVPFWVAETETFKHGIKDGSIVNLTPPHLMPGYKVEEPAKHKELKGAAPVSEEITKEPEAGPDVEQTELPKAEFGAQPMTPVQPAPKVGNIRRGGK